MLPSNFILSMLMTWSCSGLFLLLYVCLYLKVNLKMFINIDSSYKDVFCCFCLIFTTVFQFFLDTRHYQNFLVEQLERGIGSV